MPAYSEDRLAQLKAEYDPAAREPSNRCVVRALTDTLFFSVPMFLNSIARP